jgi:hypothetical protein
MSFFVGVDVSKEKFAIADIFMNGLRGNRPRATVTMLVETAVSSVGVRSPAPEIET